MPGRDETTAPGSPQKLTGTALKGTSIAAEPMPSRGRSLALLAVLVSACLLVFTPALVAGMSLIDPGALDQTASWFQPLAPITSHLDQAKLVLAAGSMVIVWSGRNADSVGGAGS